MGKQAPFSSLQFLILFLVVVSTAQSAIGPRDTETDNRFDFTSVQYFVSKGATSAEITVHFTPGNSSWSGSVNYKTAGGTAVSNQDYTPVSGTLSFSGFSYSTFKIPLKANSPDQGQKTIGLILAPDAPGTVSNAVLNINLGPPPKLEITTDPNGTLAISWLDDGTNPFLEMVQTPFDTNWTAVSTWPVAGNGRLTVFQPISGPMGFYRLRRAQ